MEMKEKFSLCPECGACPEVEILQHEGRPVAVRIGEGEDKITLPREAWNTLLRYVREGILKEL
ncbi:hypothetical protein [Candidatus Methylomirabilis sp.]|uniref:hypothetical protein n=1 Tax=Candidatus Methylomirabilis sp. TaxID=2032687 RepID=UPI003C71173C